MNYTNYLQEALGPTVVVTEELNFNYPGTGIYCVIKYLSGSNYRESVVQPIQLSIYTDDMVGTHAMFQAFAKAYSNTPFASGLEYVQQVYSTPMVMSGYQQAGVMYTAQILVSGQLIISSNVSDIVGVKIDGVAQETTSRVLSYAAVVDNQRKSGALINVSNIRVATVKFTCVMINKNTSFNTKVRRIRTGQLEPDTAFTILLTYSDGYTETYTMKLDSQTLNSDNPSLPMFTVSFTQ